MLIIVMALLVGSGCAIRETHFYMPDDYDQKSSAMGAAYAGSALSFRKPMPRRMPDHPHEFYYKNCSLTGHSSYYSKTDYMCNSVFY